eukprot:29335-Chlamydomonas_euryale.AAC.1
MPSRPTMCARVHALATHHVCAHATAPRPTALLQPALQRGVQRSTLAARFAKGCSKERSSDACLYVRIVGRTGVAHRSGARHTAHARPPCNPTPPGAPSAPAQRRAS